MKTKKIITVTFAILYGLLTFLLFSDTLIVRIIETQKAYYLSETKNFEEITFRTNEWQQLNDKKEFKLHGHYYDVKSIKTDKHIVTATVIKDEFENLLHYLSKNIFPKNKKQKTLKHKRILPVCILHTDSDSILNIRKKNKNNFPHNSMHSKLLSQNIYRPPCYFGLVKQT